LIRFWECNSNIQKDFEHLSQGIPESTKLELFLPSKNGEGIISMALWNGREGDKEGFFSIINEDYYHFRNLTILFLIQVIELAFRMFRTKFIVFVME
jgi:hypothetical protein